MCSCECLKTDLARARLRRCIHSLIPVEAETSIEARTRVMWMALVCHGPRASNIYIPFQHISFGTTSSGLPFIRLQSTGPTPRWNDGVRYLSTLNYLSPSALTFHQFAPFISDILAGPRNHIHYINIYALLPTNEI